MSLIWILAVGLGGALGSISRLSVAHYLNGSYPWGTLFVNVLGSFILGFLFSASRNEILPPQSPAFAFLAVGFCGAFTTFSTFSLEVIKLWNEGQNLVSGLHILSNTVIALVAVLLGISAGAIAFK